MHNIDVSKRLENKKKYWINFNQKFTSITTYGDHVAAKDGYLLQKARL